MSESAVVGRGCGGAGSKDPAASRWIRFDAGVRRRGDWIWRAGIACAALAERLLGPVLVYAATFVGAGFAFAVGAALSGLFALRSLVQSVHATRTEAALYVRVVDCVLQQDVLRQSVLQDEDATATLYEGGPSLARFLADGIPNACANAAASIAFAFWAVVTLPLRIVAVACASGVIGFCLVLVGRRATEAARKAASQAWGQLGDGIGDAFGGRLEIVAAGRAGQYVPRFSEIAVSWTGAALREARISRLAGRLPLIALTGVVGVGVVVDGLLRNDASSRIVAQAALLASMAPAFVGIAHAIQEFFKNDRLLQRMLDLVTFERPSSSKGTGHLGRVRAVELQDVSFRYRRGDREHEALKGVSFTWKAGEILALSGPNGSGKSTCLRLILGLARPHTGSVRIDGTPLDSLDLDEWRRSVAYLPQRPYLSIRGSVYESLKFLDPDVSVQAMENAIERVGLSEILGRAGSLLGVRVDELSVGQKQRVALARLLCRQAPMLVLDEPDANLDRGGVDMIAALIRELSRDKMVVVVAHSSELLAVANRVITLNSGRIDPPP